MRLLCATRVMVLLRFLTNVEIGTEAAESGKRTRAWSCHGSRVSCPARARDIIKKGIRALNRFKNPLEMGKAQKKTGKGRLDKYYKLAKYVKCIFIRSTSA
jgi:hypothetical protein